MCSGGKAHTPIVSQAQQGAMGAALRYKRSHGKSKAKGVAKKMAASMTQAELVSHLEESGGKNLPARTTAASERRRYKSYAKRRTEESRANG